ncbi:MAG: hypothetical protein HND46_09630 [Chloroflexi bacterium]|nr:hypothetical protein [Chloroflexota bacterium]
MKFQKISVSRGQICYTLKLVEANGNEWKQISKGFAFVRPGAILQHTLLPTSRLGQWKSAVIETYLQCLLVIRSLAFSSAGDLPTPLFISHLSEMSPAFGGAFQLKNPPKYNPNDNTRPIT